jgi:hypothetical protein
MDLHPTHTCFDDVFSLIESPRRVTEIVPPSCALTVVHAICVGDAGELYAHAWIELEHAHGAHQALQQYLHPSGERVWVLARADEYRAAHRVRECTTYSLHEALDMRLRKRTSGPWVDAYEAVSGASQRRIVGRANVKVRRL